MSYPDYISFSVPDTETKSVRRTVTKQISEMTPEEVMEAYRQNVPQDWEPTPEQKVINEMYAMPIEELQQKADQQLKAADAQEREKYRTQNAFTWMPTEARYKRTPANAHAIVDELNAQGLRGSVAEIAAVFEHLAAQGKLELNLVQPSPKKIWTREELYAMPLERMEECIVQMAKDGIF